MYGGVSAGGELQRPLRSMSTGHISLLIVRTSVGCLLFGGGLSSGSAEGVQDHRAFQGRLSDAVQLQREPHSSPAPCVKGGKGRACVLLPSGLHHFSRTLDLL